MYLWAYGLGPASLFFSFGFQCSFGQWQINRGTASRGMGKKKIPPFFAAAGCCLSFKSIYFTHFKQDSNNLREMKKAHSSFCSQHHSKQVSWRNPKLHSWNTVRQKRFECQKSTHTPKINPTKNPRRRCRHLLPQDRLPTASLRAPSSAAPALFCPRCPEPPLPPSFPLRLRRTAKRALVIVPPG